MILLDDRTGSGHLLGPLKAKGADVEVTRLPFGDAAFVGNGPDGAVIPVGIELKAIGDMLRVISDGRFEGHQLPGLQGAYLERYLIVEGGMKCSKSGDLLVRRGPVWAPISWGRRIWRCGDVGRWLTRMEVIGGVRVRRTWTKDDTAQTILDLHDWYSKEFTEHANQREYDQPVQGLLPTNLAGRWAKELDGIGWGKGRVAGWHFKTPLALANAPAEEWMKVAGIGKTLAERAVKQIREGK